MRLAPAIYIFGLSLLIAMGYRLQWWLVVGNAVGFVAVCLLALRSHR